MNANELADELEACFTKADWNVLEAATMLRQQQAEIEMLKKELIILRKALKKWT